MQIHLSLEISEIDLVLQGLITLPFSQVYRLLDSIRGQASQDLENGASPPLTINVDIPQVNLILFGLSHLPYSTAYRLIDKIRQQAEQQIGSELPAIDAA